ncbi:hypothetical protein Dimus_025451 [Dionaea muscipula]
MVMVSSKLTAPLNFRRFIPTGTATGTQNHFDYQERNSHQKTQKSVVSVFASPSGYYKSLLPNQLSPLNTPTKLRTEYRLLFPIRVTTFTFTFTFWCLFWG